MNKLMTTVAAISLAAMTVSANSGEFRVGAIVNGAADYATATETRKDSGNRTTEEAVLAHSYASVFAEFAIDAGNGIAFGVEYAPEGIELETETRVLVGLSRLGGGSNDEGTQKIDAAVKDFMTAYVSVPFGSTGAYARLGYMTATLDTKETLVTGSTYSNVDMTGTQLGLGYMGKIGERAFYRLEGNYNAWDDMAVNGSEAGGTTTSFNKIDAKITGASARLAVGFAF